MDQSTDSNLREERPRPDPTPAALRLAVALAERLDAVVPRPFRVRADDGWVSRYHGDAWEGSSDVASVLDQPIDQGVRPGERGSFAWFAAISAEGVLSSVQDHVSEATTEPWPLLPVGAMARSGTRTDGERVYLWYGPDWERETGAVGSFEPISLDRLLDPE
jgi:hypothetical protein